MMRRTAAWLVSTGLALLWAPACSEDSDAGAAQASGASGATGGGGGAGTAAGTGSAGSGKGGSTGTGGVAGQAGTGTGGIMQTPTKTFVYVATGDWGNTGSGRVRVYSLDETTLGLSPVGETESGTLPSYLAFDPAGQTLYVGDEDEGALRAYAVDRATGRLTFLNSTATSGHPVYVSVDATARFVLAAYYNEGSAEVFAIESDRRLGASVAAPATGTQAHSIVPSPDNNFAFVPNKGSNDISQFVLGPDGSLGPNTPASVTATGGPRHLTFHPSRPLAFVVNELGSSLTAYTYDRALGQLAPIATESTLPPGSSGDSSGADVRVEPTGRFVYASNRAGAASTLAIFMIDENDGSLGLVGHEGTRGNTPRNFGIHPGGRILLVANQDSNGVAAFRLDSGSGAVMFVETTDVGDKPWCVGFLVVPAGN